MLLPYLFESIDITASERLANQMDVSSDAPVDRLGQMGAKLCEWDKQWEISSSKPEQVYVHYRLGTSSQC